MNHFFHFYKYVWVYIYIYNFHFSSFRSVSLFFAMARFPFISDTDQSSSAFSRRYGNSKNSEHTKLFETFKCRSKRKIFVFYFAFLLNYNFPWSVRFDVTLHVFFLFCFSNNSKIHAIVFFISCFLISHHTSNEYTLIFFSKKITLCFSFIHIFRIHNTLLLVFLFFPF